MADDVGLHSVRPEGAGALRPAQDEGGEDEFGLGLEAHQAQHPVAMGVDVFQQGQGFVPAFFVLQAGDLHQGHGDLHHVRIIDGHVEGGEPLVRQVLRARARLDEGGGGELYPQVARVGGVAAEAAYVVGVVAQAAHLRGDAVERGQQQADYPEEQQEDAEPEGPSVGREPEAEGHEGSQQVHADAARVVPEGGERPVGAARRSQEALAARARQLVAFQAEASVPADNGQAEYAEGEEAVARQQAAQQVPALVQQDLQEERQGGQQSAQQAVAHDVARAQLA